VGRAGRAASILAIVVGVSLIAFPLAYSLFDRTAKAERILDRFEFFTLGGSPLQRYLPDAKTTRVGSVELVNEAIPSLVSDAGVTRAEFGRFSEANLPALGAAREAVPKANEFSVRYSKQLAAVDQKFQSVYDIPTSHVPLPATAWMFLFGGVASVAVGLIALGTNSRGSIAAILALGVAIVVTLLVLSAPRKAGDGEDVKVFASRGLTAKAAGAATQASTALDALVSETNGRTLPYLARQQGISEAELRQKLRGEFPATDKFLAEWDTIGPRLSRLAAAVSDSVVEFKSVKKVPISFPVWLLFGGGIAMSLVAGIALVVARAPEGRPV
jgi:hypothetical protein